MAYRKLYFVAILFLTGVTVIGCEPSGGNIYAVNATSTSVKLFGHKDRSIIPEDTVMIAVIPSKSNILIKNALPHRFSSLFYSYTTEDGKYLGEINCDETKIDNDLKKKGYLELLLK